MALDPDLEKFLTKVSESDNEPFEIMSINDMREATRDILSFFDDCEDVAQVETRYVKNKTCDFLVRIYHPSLHRNLPVILYFHAGGYIRGDVQLSDGICRRLANRSSCIVISVNYRLAPEEVFPAALEDAYTALCWAYFYAHEYGGNKDCIAVAGDSSGANLAAVLTLVTRNRKGPKIGFQALCNPILDYTYSFPSHKEFEKGYFITEEALKFYESQYFPKDVDRKDSYVSPLFTKNFKDLPPACIITAEYDPVRDEGEAYAQKLKEHGVEVDFERFKGMTHGFIYLAGQVDAAKRATDKMADGIKATFKKAIDEATHGK